MNWMATPTGSLYKLIAITGLFFIAHGFHTTITVRDKFEAIQAASTYSKKVSDKDLVNTYIKNIRDSEFAAKASIRLGAFLAVFAMFLWLVKIQLLQYEMLKAERDAKKVYSNYCRSCRINLNRRPELRAFDIAGSLNIHYCQSCYVIHHIN